MSAHMRDSGAYSVIHVSIAPTMTAADPSLAGSSYDRTGKLSCKAVISCGTPTGNPTSFSVSGIVQESNDGTTWQALPDGRGAISAVTTADGSSSIDINLSDIGKFIRILATISFNGGSSPEIPMTGYFVVGGANVVPTT